MARLGSVLGAMIAELVRARVIADELTRQLVVEYEADPVLSSLSVPRVRLGEAQLTLRFSVQDVQEVEVEALTPSALRTDWAEAASGAMVGIIARMGLDPAGEKALREKLALGRPSLAHFGRAVSGDPEPATSAIVAPAVGAWSTLPASVRRQIGTKAEFSRRLVDGFKEELARRVDRHASLQLTRSALKSTIDVAISGEGIADGGALQEIRITLEGDDLDLLHLSVEEES